jgi:hypothetical protein
MESSRRFPICMRKNNYFTWCKNTCVWFLYSWIEWTLIWFKFSFSSFNFNLEEGYLLHYYYYEEYHKYTYACKIVQLQLLFCLLIIDLEMSIHVQVLEMLTILYSYAIPKPNLTRITYLICIKNFADRVLNCKEFKKWRK